MASHIAILTAVADYVHEQDAVIRTLSYEIARRPDAEAQLDNLRDLAARFPEGTHYQTAADEVERCMADLRRSQITIEREEVAA